MVASLEILQGRAVLEAVGTRGVRGCGGVEVVVRVVARMEEGGGALLMPSIPVSGALGMWRGART